MKTSITPIRMAIHVKLKAREKERPLHKRINYDINQLRGNTQQLLITDENVARGEAEKLAGNMAKSKNCTRVDNSKLWHLVEKAM